MRVRDVMTTTVVTARPETSFQELVDLMLRYGVSGIADFRTTDRWCALPDGLVRAEWTHPSMVGTS